MTIRHATREDIGALGAIAEEAGLFPADMLPDMISPAFEGADDVWLVAERDGAPDGFAFARPEQMTDRVWNLLAIGVHPSARGNGLGRRLLDAVEAGLPDARMIIIETTQLPEQATARALYADAGYRHSAGIPDFFADGEDKIVFVKRVEARA